MSYETLIYEKDTGIAIMTMYRPERLNALSFKLREDLSAAFEQMGKDNEVKGVILTGGEKAFSAEVGIKERSSVLMS